MVVIFLADHTRWFDFYKNNDIQTFCDKNDNFSFEAPQESDLLLAVENAIRAMKRLIQCRELRSTILC